VPQHPHLQARLAGARLMDGPGQERVVAKALRGGPKSFADGGIAHSALLRSEQCAVCLRKSVGLGRGGSVPDASEVLLGVSHEAILGQALHCEALAEELSAGVELSIAQGTQQGGGSGAVLA